MTPPAQQAAPKVGPRAWDPRLIWAVLLVAALLGLRGEHLLGPYWGLVLLTALLHGALALSYDIMEDVSKLMFLGLISCRPEDSVETVARTMIGNDIHAVIVREGDQAIGVVSQTDVVLARQGRSAEALRAMTARDGMLRPPALPATTRAATSSQVRKPRSAKCVSTVRPTLRKLHPSSDTSTSYQSANADASTGSALARPPFPNRTSRTPRRWPGAR